MTNVSIRAGSMPVPSSVLVSTDGETIGGDGTALNPLRLINAPVTEVERITAGSDPVTVSGDVPLTIGSTNITLGTRVFNLEDGEEDGFEKTITFTPTNTVTFRINATFNADAGFDHITMVPNEGGGATLVWDATNACWVLIATTGTPA